MQVHHYHGILVIIVLLPFSIFSGMVIEIDLLLMDSYCLALYLSKEIRYAYISLMVEDLILIHCRYAV